MSNVDITIQADTAADWKAVKDRFTFYAEEADIRLAAGRDLTDIYGSTYGITLRVPTAVSIRLHDIITKAALTTLHINAHQIPEHEDLAEKKIQEKLYRGGDTSNKPKEPTDRDLPSSHLSYSMSREEYCAWLKGQGRRSKA